MNKLIEESNRRKKMNMKTTFKLKKIKHLFSVLQQNMHEKQNCVKKIMILRMFEKS